MAQNGLWNSKWLMNSEGITTVHWGLKRLIFFAKLSPVKFLEITGAQNGLLKKGYPFDGQIRTGQKASVN